MAKERKRKAPKVKPSGPSRAAQRAERRAARPSSGRTARTDVKRAGLWLGSIRFSGFTLMIMGLVVLGVGILAPQIKILVDQRHQVADLQAQVDSAEANLDTLNKERARWDDPAFLRAQARDRLYYVMPGEVSYLVVRDVEIEKTKREKASDQIKDTKTDWVAGALASVLSAGLATPAPEQVQQTGAAGTTPAG